MLGFPYIVIEGNKYNSKTVFTFEGNNVDKVKLPVDFKYFKNLTIKG